MIEAKVKAIAPLVLIFIDTRLTSERAPRCPIKNPTPSKIPIPMNEIQITINGKNENP
jgi:hypothetical protein